MNNGNSGESSERRFPEDSHRISRDRNVAIISTAVILTTLGFMFAFSPRNMDIKVGYVDSSVILGLLPPARAIQARLDTLVQDWSDTLSQMASKYRDRVNQLAQQEAAMTVDARLRAQHEVDSLQQEILAYRHATIGQGGELDQMRERLMKPVREEVYSAIAEVAKRHGMDFVLDKDPHLAVVLYADPRNDITYEVLDLLNRQAAAN